MEKAFRVNKGAKLETEYFQGMAEREKFFNLAKDFVEKHNIKCTKLSFVLSKRFEIAVEKAYFQEIKSQLISGCYPDNRRFSLNSKTNKSWENEVYSKIDIKKINALRFWQGKYLGLKGGSHALWEHDGLVYGYLSNKGDEKIILSDDMEEIKMSEYYSIVEEIEENEEKQGNDE